MACARGSDALKAITTAAALGLAAGPALADMPQRVVSMNLCTDQLAMMLAAPGQLISVSDIARDPLTSPMAEQAMDYPVNHGGAEQIYLLDPDLVLAGIYSDPATISMLRRLGIEVVQINIANGLADIPVLLAEVGAHLGRENAAAEVIAQFETDLTAFATLEDGPRAAFYYPNGYTLGTGTFSHDVLTHAGFTHIAEELGRDTSGRLALELLVVAAPELIIGASPYPGASRSEDIRHHPALQSLISAGQGHTSGPDWICGTPFIIDALQDLADIRSEMTPP